MKYYGKTHANKYTYIIDKNRKFIFLFCIFNVFNVASAHTLALAWYGLLLMKRFQIIRLMLPIVAICCTSIVETHMTVHNNTFINQSIDLWRSEIDLDNYAFYAFYAFYVLMK